MDVRLRYIFTENDEGLESLEEEYNPKLYIKSKWQTPPTNENAETRLKKLESALEEASEHLKPKESCTNIKPTVENLISSVIQDKNLMVLMKDKS